MELLKEKKDKLTALLNVLLKMENRNVSYEILKENIERDDMSRYAHVNPNK